MGQERTEGSFRLGFQVSHVSIQSVLGDAFAPVELIDAAFDLGVDRFPVLQEPPILFLLGFKQAHQHFLDAAGAGRLQLLLESGLQGRIAYLDVQGLLLAHRQLVRSSHRSGRSENVNSGTLTAPAPCKKRKERGTRLVSNDLQCLNY